MLWFLNRTLTVKLAICCCGLIATAGLGEAFAFHWAPHAFDGGTPLAATSPAVVVLAAAIFVGVAGVVLEMAVARPLRHAVDALGKLADGDLTAPEADHAESKRRDEIGAMDRTIRILRKDMTEARRLRAEQQQVRLRSKRERASLMADMADRFEEVVGTVVQRVSSSATELRALAVSLSNVAQETKGEVGSVADATDQAQGSIRSVADATQHLAASVDDVKAMTTRSAEITLRAVAEADRTIATIAGLSQSAEKIGHVVDMINNVARQTNLLALNATIEAARAGEAGRGFSVVAAEVKDLANQTASATDDIRRRIEEIRGTVAGSVSAIEQIGQTIGEMRLVSERVTEAVDRQSRDTEEMKTGTRTVASLAEDVASRLTRVTDAAATTGSAAAHALDGATSLARQAELLAEETCKFAATVRAG